MDPNANLEEQRRLVKLLLDGSITTDRARSVTAHRLAELIEALDGWLSKGGFLPESWAQQAERRASQRKPL